MSNLPEKQLNENLPASLDVETFKSVYYWLNAKPDTHIKVINEPKLVKLSDIFVLNEKVKAKLNNYKLITSITSIVISFDNGETQSFSLWEGFRAHPWDIPFKTESLSISWDFTVKLENYQLAQKHTLKARIGSNLRPNEMFHIVTNSDDMLEIKENFSFLVCKVDFINVVLSKELTSIIKEWYDILQPLKEKSKVQSFVEKHTLNIARAGHYLTTFIGLLILTVAFKFHLKYIDFTTITQQKFYCDAFYWTIGLFATYFTFNLFGSYFGQQIYRKVNSYQDYHYFDITSADKNEQIKIESKNTKISINLFWNFITRLAVSLISLAVTKFWIE